MGRREGWMGGRIKGKGGKGRDGRERKEVECQRKVYIWMRNKKGRTECWMGDALKERHEEGKEGTKWQKREKGRGKGRKVRGKQIMDGLMDGGKSRGRGCQGGGDIERVDGEDRREGRRGRGRDGEEEEGTKRRRKEEGAWMDEKGANGGSMQGKRERGGGRGGRE